MAHAPMGPPLSPRETRRSGRRSAPSGSTSASKSPDSPAEESTPRPKEDARRPALVSTNGSSGRTKRMKQEDLDDSIDDHPKNAAVNGNTTATHSSGTGRSKRKGKDKESKHLAIDTVDAQTIKTSSVNGEDNLEDPLEEEEQGITRCVCGSTGEDDPDAGEFMVQCETCQAWQHGLCMGYETKEQLPEDDYHCEQCRPELHQELLKKLSKRGRQSSTTSHHNSTTLTSRMSRSHSPHLARQPAKRRNTMNSRDAAFDESLKEIIEATAAEAAAHDSRNVPATNGNGPGHVDGEEELEAGLSSRKKRKRTDDDAAPKKRTRSASSESDPLPRQSAAAEDTATPNAGNSGKATPLPVPPAKNNGGRSKRGGGRKTAPVQDASMPVEGQEAPPLKRSHHGRNKAGSTPKRPPASHASGSTAHDHSTRRNQVHGVNGPISHGANSAEASRAYRNSHAYAVSQQPLYTSWNLPDYLAHLEHMLPTDVPRPLEVRGSAVGQSGRESLERTMERGVKVKWPGKRMSVGDMNKRVRALVEWVGREQAGALDRERRKEALEKALKEAGKLREAPPSATLAVLEQNDPSRAAPPENANGKQPETVPRPLNLEAAAGPTVIGNDPHLPDGPSCTMDVDAVPKSLAASRTSSTMTMMEDLMKELIQFQERFGPGVKNRERERRIAAM